MLVAPGLPNGQGKGGGAGGGAERWDKGEGAMGWGGALGLGGQGLGSWGGFRYHPEIFLRVFYDNLC